MIDNLTPEQITQIPVYREKWRNIALSTDRIERPSATEAVKNLYEIIGVKPPKIAWFDSPYAALLTIAPILGDGITNPIGKNLKTELGSPLVKELKSQIASKYYRELTKQFKSFLETKLKSQFQSQIKKELAERFRRELISQFGADFRGKYKPIINLMVSQSIAPESLACWGSLLDFAGTELKCNLDEKKWLAFQSVVNSCGWVFAFENTVIVCDRPNKLLFNSQGMLHAEAEPAISFVDNYRIYAYRGVILPVQYGMLPPSKWHSKWLLKNHRVEVKKAIIEAIGETIIKEELTPEELKLVWEEQAEYIKEQKAKKQQGKESVAKNKEKQSIKFRVRELEKKWQAIAVNKTSKITEEYLEKNLNKISAFIGKENLPTKVIVCRSPAWGLGEIIDEKILGEISQKLVNYLINQNDELLQEALINDLNYTDLGMTTTDLLIPVFSEELTKSFKSLDSLEVYSPLADLGEALEREISSQIVPKFKEKFSKNVWGIEEKIKTNLERNIYHNFIQKTSKKLLREINGQVGQQLEIRLGKKSKSLLMSQLRDICVEQLGEKLYSKFADLGKYYQLGAWLDFCTSALGYKCDAEMWSAFQELAANCRWIFATENVCVVANVSLNYRVKVKARERNAKVSDRHTQQIDNSVVTVLQGSDFYQKAQGTKEPRNSLRWMYDRKQKQPMPLWKKTIVIFFWGTFGLPLLAFSYFLDLINLGTKSLKFIWRGIWLLIIVFPIEFGTRYSGFFIGLFGLVLIAPIMPFLWLWDLFNFHRSVVHRQDSEGFLHAEGKPAVILGDGTKQYFHHGVRLWSPRYWVHPRHWRVRWLLTESDPDVFDVVIEEIGYARVCMELRTRTLDRWREYSLLEFPDLTDPNDFFNIVVLKMTCPSTGSVHALRVPPNIRTARRAIRWTNWGTDPEEFVVET